MLVCCFTCLRNSTCCKLRCVGNFNRNTYQLVNDKRTLPAEIKPASVICTPLQAFMLKTDANSELHVTRQTELHFRHRVPYSSGWIEVSERPSQLALDLVAFPASQAYVERLFSLI